MATIRTWPKRLYGPRMMRLERLLITQDPELLTSQMMWLPLVEILWSLHIKLGRYLASSIVSSDCRRHDYRGTDATTNYERFNKVC